MDRIIDFQKHRKRIDSELALGAIETKKRSAQGLEFKNNDKGITLEDLAKQVLKKSPYPLDYFEVAANLESLGWNDLRAAETFGAADVFELAMLLWDMVQDRINVQPFMEMKKMGFVHIVVYTVKSFLRGMMFALPMAISVVAMLTLRFSLWSYEKLSVELATSIAIGTILSFICVGGFMQAIARRGFFYINQGFFNMAKRITYYFIKLGYICAIAVALFYMLFNAYFENFPAYMFVVTIVYYFFLCANWLSVTVMYILKREFTFTALITLGIIFVYILFSVVGLNIIYSQLIAMSIVSALGLFLIVYFFNLSEGKMERGIAPPLPKKSILIYSLKPYFYYGFLYYLFLFTDRIMAWTTNQDRMPYVIWFRGDYELGLDFALLMLIIPLGFSEVIVTRLMENLELTQKNSLFHEIKGLSQKYLKLYGSSMVIIIIFSIMSAFSVYKLIQLLSDSTYWVNTDVYTYFQKLSMMAGHEEEWLAHSNALTNNPVTEFVFFYGLVSYTILCITLTNAVILFSLAQPEMVTKTMGLGVLVNFFTGFLATRWGSGYFGHGSAEQFAVFGLVAGTMVIAVISTGYVIKVLKNLDYYIYSAS